MRRESHILIVASFMLGALGSSCTREEAFAGQPAVVADTTEASMRQAAKTKVSKIVFVDKQDACECTRERADGSWTALQSVLGGREDILVERIYVDTNAEKVALYKKMRAIMVIPAVYVLDASGVPIDVLQGEITTEQLTEVLK